MATPREQFIANRKSGMTPVQAREEVMKTVTPASPTANANVAQLEANKAKVQAEIQAWTRPEVGTSVTPQAGQTQAPTPVLPTAPTTTPSGATMNADWTVTPTTPVTETPATPTTPTTPVTETPAPTTPVTPTAVTPVVDKNAEIKAKNEAKLAENQQKAKLAEEQRQKWITEQNTALANNEWAILNTLKTGWMIPESVKTSPFYKSAQQTYNKLQQYSTYSTNELVTAMNQGSIVPWTNVYNEMMKDPAMKQKLTDAQVYRAWNPVNSTQIYENASSDILSNNPTTANYLADGVITQEEYDQATNNTQVVAKAKEVEEKANKYNTLKAEYDSIEDEVNAQFPWSPFADSIIADRQKAKYKNLVLAKWEWETATGTLTELKSQASTLFETNLNLAEKRREEQNQIASEQRAVQRSKDALQYEADFNKKQAEAALNDPATAIKSVMDEYKKLGIPFTSTVQSRLAEFKASGKPLEQFLTEMSQNIQDSPAYKQYSAKKAGEGISYQTIGDKVYKNTNGVLTETGISAKSAPTPVWQEWEDASGKHAGWVTPWVTPSTSTATAVKPTGNIVPVTAGNKTVRLDQSGAGWFETAINQLTTAWIPIVVWQGARDQTATIKEMADKNGIPFNANNPAETAAKIRAKWIPVADPWKSNHENGMAIDVYWDNSLNKVSPAQEKILNANGWYSAGIPRDAGHFEYRGGGTGTQGASSDAQNWFNLIQKGTTSYEDVMKKLWGTKVWQAVLQEINWLISSQGGAIPALPDSPQVKQMDTLLDTVKWLVNDPNAIENLSGFFQTSPLDAMTGKNDDTRSAIEFLVKWQTLQQLIDAKAQGATFGALSNEELKMLQNSANRLTSMIEFDETGKVKNFKWSEKTVKAELKKLLDTFTEKREKMVNPWINKNIVPNQSVPVQTTTNTGVGQTTGSRWSYTW